MKGIARALWRRGQLAALTLAPALTLLASTAAMGQQASGLGEWTARVDMLPEPELVVGGPGSANYRLAAMSA